jgi:RNA polymerase sigma-70 factor (ECF subfamily)
MSSDSIAHIFPLLRVPSDSSLSCPAEIEDKEAKQSLPSLTLQCDSTDEVLLVDAASGSKDAVGLLFRRYRHVVLGVARRILRDAAEAEDLCQDVFIYIFQRAKLFDPGKGTASSWIIQIAYHRAVNRRHYLSFRQHYTVRELEPDRIGSKVLPLVTDELSARALLSRLREKLSPEQRVTLELHFFEGYTLREIAEKTGQTFGNVRHHYYRALERLRSVVFQDKEAGDGKLERKVLERG